MTTLPIDEASPFQKDKDGRSCFFVIYFGEGGDPQGSEVVWHFSKSGVIALIGGRFANRREPGYACGFFVRPRRIGDNPTMAGTIHERKHIKT